MDQANLKLTSHGPGLKKPGCDKGKMKKIIALLLLVMALSPQSLMAAGPEEEGRADPLANGTRGLAWAADINDLQDMRYVNTYEDYQYYTRDEDRLLLGTIPLKQVLYGFRNGKFAYLGLVFDRKPLLPAVLEHYSLLLGPPDQTDELAGKYRWTKGEVELEVYYDEFEGEGFAHHYYKPLLR